MKAFPCKIRLIQPADLAEFKELRLFAIQNTPSAFTKSGAEFKEFSDELLISMVCPGETQFAAQPAARTLYLSLGFKIYGKELRALKVGKEYFSEELMALDLLEGK